MFFRYLFQGLSFVFFILNVGHAAGIRCELVRDSCLDLTKVSNPTITVPSNTTRIDKSGLAVCLPYLTTYKAVDLVFIIDQSGSMVETDPEKLVSPAALAALALMDSLSPQSNVGYIGFSNGVCDGQQKNIERGKGAGQKYEEKKSTLVFPRELTDQVHKDSLLEPMTFSPDNFLTDCGSLHPKGYGTNYYRPFLLAEEWFDQMDTRNKQIIIFLTDGGNNTERSEYQEMLLRVDSTNFAKVNAIFVNSGQNPDLELMTEKTSGTYAQVEDFTNVKDVMMKMVGASLIPNSPEHTTVKKNGELATQTPDHTYLIETNFQVNMPHDLSLEIGENKFTVNSKTEEMGNKENGFQIQVSGPAATTLGNINIPGNNLFDLVCSEASKIIPFDKSFTAPITQLGAYNIDAFGIGLKTPADDITAVVNVKGIGDSEDFTLTAIDSGYRGPAPFKNANLKTPKNGTVEGLVDEPLILTWAHPYDPRDTAITVLPIYDDRPDTTVISFADLNGNPISSITDFEGNQFKLVVRDNKAKGPFTVTLTSTQNDTLKVTVKNVGPQMFEAVVTFGFAGAVNPANRTIEGIFNPASGQNKTTVTASVKAAVNSLLVEKIFTPLKNVWIVDENEDGRADKIFIQFTEAVKKMPARITDIRWPAGHSKAKRAPASDDKPGDNPLSFVNNDSSLVQIDFSKDQFEYGATGAFATSKPTLTLPDGRKPEIQDSLKPILLAAEKKPSDFARYIRASDGVAVSYPDSLIITLSEPISPISGSSNPWPFLLLIEKGGKQMLVDITKEPKVLSNDGRTWLLIIDNKLDSNTVKVGDKISLNPVALYSDTTGNSLSGLQAKVGGRDGSKGGFASAWRGGSVSGDNVLQTNFASGPKIPVIDEAKDSVLRYVPIAAVEGWAVPVALNIQTGNVDFAAQLRETCKDENPRFEVFPVQCYASRVILTGVSDGPYITNINIYDNLGKFVRNLKQAFGYCGELGNKARLTESGLIMNDLMWNLKDSNGKRVGSGVYIWKITLKFSDGYIRERIFKMGVLSEDRPWNDCIGLSPSP